MKLAALCSPGLEKALGWELKTLGYPVIERYQGRLVFETDDLGPYRATLYLRTAERVLVEVGQAPADGFDPFFDQLKSFEWKNYLSTGSGIRISKIRSYKSEVKDSRVAQKMAHKAILEALGEGKSRPLQKPAEIRIYLENNVMMAYLDLTGEGMHKRGYRAQYGKAPLRETLAAGLIMYSGWKPRFPLHDPFCGSGTIPIEAGLMAGNRPPGLKREFALKDFAFYREEIDKEIRKSARQQVISEIESSISGSDKDPSMIEIAQGNAFKANLKNQILFYPEDVLDGSADFDNGYVICNPPYGERLEDKEEAYRLYSKLAYLREAYPHWRLGILTSVLNFERHFGENAQIKRKIKNGSLDLIFFQYHD